MRINREDLSQRHELFSLQEIIRTFGIKKSMIPTRQEHYGDVGDNIVNGYGGDEDDEDDEDDDNDDADE